MTVDPFNIRALVTDFEAWMDDYRVASAATRSRLRARIDLRYGPGPRQRLDLFFPQGDTVGRPIHVFIHGGYWRAQVKEDYSFVADGVIAAGAIAAIVEYTLMPANRMPDLVGETRAALAWLAEHAVELGGDPAKLSASGHSAGAHLCSYLASRGPHEETLPAPPLRSVLLLSGLYDLQPISSSYLQPELHLTDEEVLRWSPMRSTPAPGAHFAIAYGSDESEPFHRQAADYEAHLAAAGSDVERVVAAGRDHMSIVRDLGRPETPTGRLLAEAIRRSIG